MTRPKIVESRELHVLGSRWRDVLAVDRHVVSGLLSTVAPDVLLELDRHTPAEASVDVLVGDEAVSLWLGETRLAVLPWEAKR